MRKKNNNASQTSLSSIILLSSSITLLCTNACQTKKVYINYIMYLFLTRMDACNGPDTES